MICGGASLMFCGQTTCGLFNLKHAMWVAAQNCCVWGALKVHLTRIICGYSRSSHFYGQTNAQGHPREYRRTDGQTSGWIQYTPFPPSVERGYNNSKILLAFRGSLWGSKTFISQGYSKAIAFQFHLTQQSWPGSQPTLTYWGQDKMPDIWQTMFSWIKQCQFLIKFCPRLFPRCQIENFGNDLLLNRWQAIILPIGALVYWHIYIVKPLI